MPYKIDTDKKLLPKKLDRRIKLTEVDKIAIRILIDTTWLSNKEIWDMFWVHRKTIYLIRKPTQAQKEKDAYKLRRLDWRYYNKEKQTIAIRDTRKHRYNNKNKLLDNKNND